MEGITLHNEAALLTVDSRQRPECGSGQAAAKEAHFTSAETASHLWKEPMLARLSNISGDNSLARLAYDAISSMLAEGGVAPGERLVETSLSDALGVSRGPVRQALQQLAAEGWVEIRPRLGAFVAHRDRKAAEDFFLVRQELEVIAAGLAAVARSEGDLVCLRTCISDAEQMSARMGAPIEVDEASARAFHKDTAVKFHEYIAHASRNETLKDVLGLLVKKTRWYFSSGVLCDSQRAWKEHKIILGALEARDAELAKRLMGEHMENTRKTYVEHLR